MSKAEPPPPPPPPLSRLGGLVPAAARRVPPDAIPAVVASKTPKTLKLLGLPTDQNSSFLRGTAKAPSVIRTAIESDSANPFSEGVVDVGAVLTRGDLGDLDLKDDGTEEARQQDRLAIRTAAATITQDGSPLLCIGGDHSVTFPIIEAIARKYPGRLEILHFDAHPDMYDSLLGNRLSHASPFARILEAGLVRGLTQLGIRTENAHQQQQRRNFGGRVRSFPMRSFPPPPEVLRFAPDAVLYISVDIDALDPAFAPGVSHHEPGGLSTRELLKVLAAVEAPGGVVGADLVEYNPQRDVDGMTGMVAAKVLKELAEVVLRCRGPSRQSSL